MWLGCSCSLQKDDEGAICSFVGRERVVSSFADEERKRLEGPFRESLFAQHSYEGFRISGSGVSGPKGARPDGEL